MTLEWVTHSIKKNPVIFILVLTIVVGYGYGEIPMEWFPEGKVQHPNPPENPHSYWWFGKFITIYLVHFSFEWALILSTRGVTKDIVISYFLFDFVGFLSYLYQGWPEPKEVIIIGFCLSCVMLLTLRIWNYQK